jgi:LPXTG-motif cell wall-anchored protein
MNAGWRRFATIVGGAALVTTMLTTTVTAGASTATGSVGFGQADFHGYSSGEELNLGALTLNGDSVAGVEQGYSSASANTAGLATPIVGDSQDGSLLVQPKESASNNAYASGAGPETGLEAPSNASGDQLKLAGLAQQVAAPNNSEVVTSLPNPELQLSGIATNTGALQGRAAAIYDTETCPLGQPISYGLGDAANTDLVNLSQLTGVSTAFSALETSLGPALKTLGFNLSDTGNLISNPGDARTTSDTYLSSNGDGTFGFTTQETVNVAPITLNILGLAQVDIVVGGSIANPSAGSATPITLTAKTTGEGSGAEVGLTDNDVISVDLVVAGTTTKLLGPEPISDIVSKGGTVVNLSLASLSGDLDALINNLSDATLVVLGNQLGLGSIPVLGGILQSTLQTDVENSVNTALTSLFGTLGGDTLGSIDIGTPVRAINGPATSKPTPPVVGAASSSEGTTASAAFDLLKLNLGGSGTILPTPSVLDLNLLHMEAAANLSAPITCNIPVVKTSNPTSVAAGDNFAYTIDIPTPSQIPYLDCNLDDIKATDTITDASGTPSFTVTGATGGGTVTQTSATTATVTWTGLSYKVAPVGSPPNPPIQLVIYVKVPSSSTAGVVQDLVTANATLGACNGGASGVTGLGGATGTALTGQYTLSAPTVTAASQTVSTVAPGSSTAPGAVGNLPRTGGTGGFWQPGLGLFALGLGGGALGLVRRSRRRAARL